MLTRLYNLGDLTVAEEWVQKFLHAVLIRRDEVSVGHAFLVFGPGLFAKPDWIRRSKEGLEAVN